VPENAENGDFGHTAPLTGPQIKGNFNKIGWQGERIACQCQFFSSLLEVDRYMKYRAESAGRRSLKDVTTKIRSFLRWLYMTERTSRDLSSTVIAPMLYAFESIPSALRSGDVEKILAATRQDCTPKGIRDYAILMLISKYGIRSGEIATLRLDDVDWHQEVIRIRHSKTGAISYLPLLPEVGEAVLKYLQDSRPKTSFREIFIRACAPYRPFRCGSSLYRLVRHRLEAATMRLSVPVDRDGSIGPPTTTRVSSTASSSDPAEMAMPRLFVTVPASAARTWIR